MRCVWVTARCAGLRLGFENSWNFPAEPEQPRAYLYDSRLRNFFNFIDVALEVLELFFCRPKHFPKRNGIETHIFTTTINHKLYKKIDFCSQITQQ